MLKGLQKNAGGYRETSTPVRESTLILDNSYVSQVFPFILDCKSEVRLCAYAWRWYEADPGSQIQKLNTELLRLSRRGVQVRVLVDTQAMKQTFCALGFNARCVAPTRMLHTKAICFDRKTLVLGSHNLTKRAVTDNYEMSILTQEVEPVLQFIEYFDRLWLSRA